MMRRLAVAAACWAVVVAVLGSAGRAGGDVDYLKAAVDFAECMLTYGGDGQNKHITTYFRHTFTLQHAWQISDVTVNLMRDDGAVVYLNGQELFRDNIDAGPVDYRTTGASTNNCGRWMSSGNSLPTAFTVNGAYQHGGEVQRGDLLTMAASGQTIYYTLDGTDPRLPGGDVAPVASGPTREASDPVRKSRTGRLIRGISAASHRSTSRATSTWTSAASGPWPKSRTARSIPGTSTASRRATRQQSRPAPTWETCRRPRIRAWPPAPRCRCRPWRPSRRPR